MKYVLGLTGPTGSGKSTVADLAAGLGWFVIDCDKLVKRAYLRPEVLEALRAAFGEDIFDRGQLVRGALAKKAFATREGTELLNKTVLPFITEMIKDEIAAAGDKVLLDAPTLYESGADALCDSVCALLAEDEVRLSRILSRDNITAEAAALRMSAGKPDDFYKNRAQYILYNNGDTAEIIKAFTKILTDLGGN